MKRLIKHHFAVLLLIFMFFSIIPLKQIFAKSNNVTSIYAPKGATWTYSAGNNSLPGNILYEKVVYIPPEKINDIIISLTDNSYKDIAVSFASDKFIAWAAVKLGLPYISGFYSFLTLGGELAQVATVNLLKDAKKQGKGAIYYFGYKYNIRTKGFDTPTYGYKIWYSYPYANTLHSRQVGIFQVFK